MNKNDLVDSVAAAANMTKADATTAVDAVFESITTALKGGGEVRLSGFGTFAVTQRAASEGRNPRTGEKIQIPGLEVAEIPRRQGIEGSGSVGGRLAQR